MYQLSKIEACIELSSPISDTVKVREFDGFPELLNHFYDIIETNNYRKMHRSHTFNPKGLIYSQLINFNRYL